MDENTRVVTVAVIAVLVGALIGYFFGTLSTKQKIVEADKRTEELRKTLDVFVPPLPDVISVIGGKITAMNSDALTFTMEIPSFTDRYPKLGVPMATETKAIRIAQDAKITNTSFDPKTFKNGVPQQKTILFGDLKIGDTISVTVKENARTEQNLTAVSISRSSGI